MIHIVDEFISNIYTTLIALAQSIISLWYENTHSLIWKDGLTSIIFLGKELVLVQIQGCWDWLQAIHFRISTPHSLKVHHCRHILLFCLAFWVCISTSKLVVIIANENNRVRDLFTPDPTVCYTNFIMCNNGFFSDIDTFEILTFNKYQLLNNMMWSIADSGPIHLFHRLLNWWKLICFYLECCQFFHRSHRRILSHYDKLFLFERYMGFHTIWC